MALTTIMTPWYRRTDAGSGSTGESGSIGATAILDHRSPAIAQLVARASAQGEPPLSTLAAAHAIIRDEVRPVYALAEQTPASRVLARGYGSCSQRLAILESVARAIGIRTRVRALLIDRAFWYPRFPRLGFALPDRMLLAWPEFELEEWRPASELFGSIGCQGGGAFTNRGAETLFEAAGRCAVDWDGRTGDSEFDLSRFVRADYGYFADRDKAFSELGQTLSLPFRLVADPILRRVSA